MNVDNDFMHLKATFSHILRICFYCVLNPPDELTSVYCGGLHKHTHQVAGSVLGNQAHLVLENI